MCVCVSFCSHWFLSHVKSNWGVWDIFGAGLAKACRILSFTQFHAISCNFSYFSHFWANFNMLGIKMHVLELWTSMVIPSHIFTHSLTQFHILRNVQMSDNALTFETVCLLKLLILPSHKSFCLSKWLWCPSYVAPSPLKQKRIGF